MAVQNQRLQPGKQRNSSTTAAPQPPVPPQPTPMPRSSKPQAGTMPTRAAQSQAEMLAPLHGSNGGPRVSFNRDVHVKRIGKHSNDLTNYETTNLQPPQHPAASYLQLPADLSAESIRKEAALVLAQAGGHKSTAENADKIPNFKVRSKRAPPDASPKKFHSLPTRRRKSAAKPVARSVSDAAAKKAAKRPSIFSIFSRKSDSNISQVERDPRFEDSGGRRLVRSKSDVGAHDGKDDRKSRKAVKEQSKQAAPPPLSGSAKNLPPSQLSPIIENAQKEDFFAEQFNRERRKSDAITHREKHESGLSELLERSRLQADEQGSLLQIGKTPVSSGIQEKIRNLQTKSGDSMHSSQQPAQKLPLTKGVTVNGMVKRLSMERFSPPPTISGPAFSYTRPNEGVITYAQLDHNDDQHHHHHQYDGSSLHRRREGLRSPSREVRTPLREVRTPLREVRTPLREVRTPLREYEPRYSVDRVDTFASQTAPARNGYSPSYMNTTSHRSGGGSGRAVIDAPVSRTPIGPTTIRISSSHSPSPWQQLSPRNLSDEDEGLGYETRKYYHHHHDEELAKPTRSKSPSEPPIVPLIRSITPPLENGYREPEPDADFGYRRARLESRILTRTLDRNGAARTTPERNREVREVSATPPYRYLSPEREEALESRFHRPGTKEILHKYSPERSHLDIIAPPLRSGGDYKTERLQLFSGVGGGDYEPKSLDSQFTGTDQYRSSPENMKRYENSVERVPPPMQRLGGEPHWQSSLKRDKLQQRSFDKGDSGIENDFRKESFNGDLGTRWRKRNPLDDMRACEAFLKKERRHTEQQQLAARQESAQFVYRERSIDDGSHFDPHLDKYPTATSTLRRREPHSHSHSPQGQDTLKRNKKLGGFEKVKQLFIGGGGAATAGSGGSSSSTNTKKDSHLNGPAGSERDREGTPAGLPKTKDKYMVKEEEMRSRYAEHHGAHSHTLPNGMSRDPKPTDISMRRRLSTPKASPLLLKRTSSDKAKKESPLAKPEKTSWFKSLDRRAKNKSKEKLNVTVNGQSEISSIKRSKTARSTLPPPIPPKNLRFFGDTDLDSNPPTISRVNTTSKTRPSLSSTLNRSQKYSQSAYHLDRLNASPPKTDYRRHMSSPLTHSAATSRHRSTSMHNLENGGGGAGGGTDEVDFRKRRHYSRSRDLDDISESGSETEDHHKRHNGFVAGGRSLSRERLDRPSRFDDHAHRRSNERQAAAQSATLNGGVGETGGSTPMRRSHHLTGPPKPARSAERRLLSSYSRERDRYPAESSGTEGESSLHSQRSIVYLHATTVGAIPQPYQLRRRSISRDDLRSNKGKVQPLQPMTRTVSRSVSMLAPWKPKLISEGYEINYSQEQNKKMATLPPRKPAHLTAGNTNSLTRPGKKPTEGPSSRSRRSHDPLKDDQASLRNSSTTSASKSVLSSNLRNGDVRRKPK